MNIREHLPVVQAPESVWKAIDAAMQDGQYLVRETGAPRWPSRWRMGLAAAAALSFVAAGLYWFGIRQAGWIETGAAAGLRLRIGDIGSVDLGPGTRLRVVTDRADQHRLSLAHGAIYARINAPPRLFFVDTRSGTAVDLGCEYALNMDARGAGMLRVTRGWVSFQWKGVESLVPAGAVCRIRPLNGPYLPYFADAAPEFVESVERSSVDSMLGYARVRDTLTLWHLLSRAAPGDRGRVYDRIAALTPLPAGVSRERALALDVETLKFLREELAWKW